MEELHPEDLAMLGSSLEGDMVYPSFTIIEILSPYLIVLVIAMLFANAVYQKYILKQILVLAASSAEQRKAVNDIEKEIRATRAEIAKLTSPHHFAQQALLKRKLAKLEPTYNSIAPQVKHPEKFQPSLHSFLSTILPMTILLGVAIANRNVSLFRFSGSPDTATGCLSSILNVIGYPFMDKPMTTFSGYLGDMISNCTPLRVLSSGTAGVLLWVFIIQRAINYIVSVSASLSKSK